MSKTELLDEKSLAKVQKTVKKYGERVLLVSAAAHQGLDELKKDIFETLQAQRGEPIESR